MLGLMGLWPEKQTENISNLSEVELESIDLISLVDSANHFLRLVYFGFCFYFCLCLLKMETRRNMPQGWLTAGWDFWSFVI